MSDFKRCVSPGCKTDVWWVQKEPDLWLCPQHMRAEVERLRQDLTETKADRDRWKSIAEAQHAALAAVEALDRIKE